MARGSLSNKIDDLFRRGAWAAARKLLEAERERAPQDHWILTQLGVTCYEERRYEEALPLFLQSLAIVGDCPLTLWNLAGTLDVLGQPAAAKRIYTWLLESKTSPNVDPCWESQEWADALKTDAVFRLGVCFQHLGKKDKAERCFRQYLDLLLSGIDGTYPVEDVTRHIRDLRGARKNGTAGDELRKAVHATLETSGVGRRKGPRKPPTFTPRELGKAVHE